MLISAIVFDLLGTIMIIFDQAYIKGLQFIITASVYLIALNRMKRGLIYLTDGKSRNEINLNLGFIFTVIGITSPLGTAMFTMWSLGFILFLLGTFGKSEEDAKQDRRDDDLSRIEDKKEDITTENTESTEEKKEE